MLPTPGRARVSGACVCAGERRGVCVRVPPCALIRIYAVTLSNDVHVHANAHRQPRRTYAVVVKQLAATHTHTHLPEGEIWPVQGSAYSLVACALELAHYRDPLEALNIRDIVIMREVLAAKCLSMYQLGREFEMRTEGSVRLSESCRVRAY